MMRGGGGSMSDGRQQNRASKRCSKCKVLESDTNQNPKPNPNLIPTYQDLKTRVCIYG